MEPLQATAAKAAKKVAAGVQGSSPDHRLNAEQVDSSSEDDSDSERDDEDEDDGEDQPERKKSKARVSMASFDFCAEPPFTNPVTAFAAPCWLQTLSCTAPAVQTCSRSRSGARPPAHTSRLQGELVVV